MTCIKGKYANDRISTYNYIQVPWKMVREFFPDALVFTSSSIQNKSATLKKGDLTDGEYVYGIIQPRLGKESQVHIYKYKHFQKKTSLRKINVSGENILVIGNDELHFITSFINDSGADFKVVQNQFPIIMQDSEQNQWDIFGVAVSGPRKGDQLQSKTGFTALWWGWKGFYKDFIF